MAVASVLLINLAAEEIRHIQDLLSHFEIEIGSTVVTTIEEVGPLPGREDLLLAVHRVDEQQKRPDQDLHRIRRSIGRSVPLLVLVPPDLAGKVREYLRAGADEYWILPMDPVVFPPRFRVLVEWGRSAFEDEKARESRARVPRSKGMPLWGGAWSALRSLFGWKAAEKGAASEPSQVFAGSWEKVRRLGFGSFGEVWLVQRRGGNHVAVAKIPHSARMNTLFIREAAILKRLSGHPNVVELIEVQEENGKVILIEEYVEGFTLQEFLDEGMESSKKEKAFLELLDVVAFAHRQRIMHRDIKPDNIIVTLSGRSKLLDFGTAKDLTRKITSSTVVGSRPYMAPEQIAGSSGLGSDVWAMGVLLFALATGLLPFYDDNEKKLMDMILECEPEAPRSLEPELSEQLEEIILRCLHKDPQMRFKDAEELKRELMERVPSFGDGQTLPG